MLTVLVLDPGNSTGWLVRSGDGALTGGTIKEDLKTLCDRICYVRPEVLVYETFHLYPGAAKHLTHNDFYPCQVIGATKYSALLCAIPYVVGLSPSSKNYSGGLDERWIMFRQSLDEQSTEHLKDAYLLLRYFELHVERSNKIEKYRTPATF